MATQAPTTHDAIDQAVADLSATKQKWRAAGGLSLDQRKDLAHHCLARTFDVVDQWIEAACEAKGVDPRGADGAEEIMAGPLATVRCLRLILATLDRASTTLTEKSNPPGASIHPVTRRPTVQVFPAPVGLYDKLLFRGFRSHVWLQENADVADASTASLLKDEKVQAEPAVCLVLGAGNVSSIAPTDLFSKLFLHGRPVLLKMNPVNEYMSPIFEQAFNPLLAAGCLRIISGGADVGQYAVGHPQVDEIHITGSDATHRAIVGEGETRLTKPITSELGNVTPWIIVPGRYSPAELAFQAENIAASIVNNASFNCVATKVIVTDRNWPQRDEFLNRIDSLLQATPARPAYYPGAHQRFARFAGESPPEHLTQRNVLPWTLLRDVSPEQDGHLFSEESFVCVTAEAALDSENAADFLDRAVGFVNDQLWGTLAANVTVPRDFRKSPIGEETLWRSVAKLRYGTVAINHWAGLAFAWMSTPWGGYPGGTLDDPQSGIGWVHDVFVSRGVEKSVLEGPLVVRPKPAWFPTHRTSAALARAVIKLYRQPGLAALPRVLFNAMRG